MEDIQRGKREASPVACCSCSSQVVKKPKSDITFHLSEKVANSADVLKDFWLADDATKGVKTFCDGDVSVLKVPFRSCHALNFISDEPGKSSNLEKLKEELLNVPLKQKSNDLFNFKQSLDLISCSDNLPIVDALKTFLLTQVKPWLMTVTGISDLSDKIDMFCAKYSHGDYLLCHDDQLEGRRIAYILYLVDEAWTAEDGGSLDLFSSEDGVPTQVAHSFVPKLNSFAFFPVSKRSFHQVSEVLASSRDRLSITGWFYGETLPTNPVHVRDDLLTSWINPKYFTPSVRTQIRAKFLASSNISLNSFLDPEKYSKVLEALSTLQKSWMRVGPPNVRNFHRLELDPEEVDGPEIKLIGECLSIFKSYEFLSLLSFITGIDQFVEGGVDEPSGGGSKKEKEKQSKWDNNQSPDEVEVPCEIVFSSDDDDDEVVCLTNPVKRLDVQRLDDVVYVRDDDFEHHDDDDDDDDDDGCKENEIVYLSSDEEDEPPSLKMQPEVRRWKAGDYTLLQDMNFYERKNPSLDICMFFLDESPWDQDWGGSTNYIAQGDSHQHLSILPTSNSLSLVLNQPEVEPFVKYINNRSGPKTFFDFSLSINVG